MKRGCTQCGECLNVCPVYKQFLREEYSPKGKRLLLEPLDKEFNNGKEVDEELSWEHIRDLARLCAGCGKCKQACARKLSTADLLSDARANHPHWTQHFWKIWIDNMGPMWPSLGLMASIMPDGLAPGPLRPLLQTGKTLARRKAVEPWAVIAKKPGTEIDPRPVLLFSGCTANNVRKEWKEKTNALLKAWGYTVADPSGLTCCGGTMHTAGLYEKMEEMREQNVAYWRKLGKPRIAVFCASCHHGLAEYADSTLTGEEAGEWTKSLTPVATLLQGAEVREFTRHKPERFGYHQPCHWSKDSDMPFLKDLLPGLHKGNGICCGMGGIFQLTNPELSRKMALTCMEGFFPGCTSVLTGCSGCAMQLTAASGKDVTVNHWLDVVTPAG